MEENFECAATSGCYPPSIHQHLAKELPDGARSMVPHEWHLEEHRRCGDPMMGSLVLKMMAMLLDFVSGECPLPLCHVVNDEVVVHFQNEDHEVHEHLALPDGVLLLECAPSEL